MGLSNYGFEITLIGSIRSDNYGYGYYVSRSFKCSPASGEHFEFPEVKRDVRSCITARPSDQNRA